MIPVGTKIAVIASATSAKGSNVRKGSLGYVASLGKTYELGKAAGYGGAMRVVPARIIFTRFGFESKSRSELKYVALIYPTLKSDKVKNCQAYLEKIVKSAQDHAGTIRALFKHEGSNVKKITPVVVSALNTTQDVTVNKNEYLSWFRSTLLSGAVSRVMFAAHNDALQKTFIALTGDKLSTKHFLRMSMASRKDATSYVENLFVNKPKEASGLAVRLQETLKLYRLSRLSEVMESMRRPFYGGGADSFTVAWMFTESNMKKYLEQFPRGNSRAQYEFDLAQGWVKEFNKITERLI